jgi:hypothetical protein
MRKCMESRAGKPGYFVGKCEVEEEDSVAEWRWAKDLNLRRG